MRRYVAWMIVSVLVISLAAPAGAVFATEEVVEGGVSAEVMKGSEAAAVEAEVVLSPTDTPGASIDQVPAVEPVLLDDSLLLSVESNPPRSTEEDTSTTPAPPALNTPPTAPVQTEPVTTPAVVVTTFDVSDALEFVEVYNQSVSPVAVGEILFKAQAASGDSCSVGVAEQGWLLAGEFMVVTSPAAGSGGRHFTGECELTGGVSRLEVIYERVRLQLIDGIAQKGGSWLSHKGAWYNSANSTSANPSGKRKNFSSIKQTGSFVEDYGYITALSGAVGESSLYDTDLYSPPSYSDLRIIELLTQPRSSCMPSDKSLDCYDYVKIVNVGQGEVNLAEYRVRVGAKSSGATATTSFNWHEPTMHPARDELIIAEGGVFLLRYRNDGQPLNLANGSSQVWIEDYYGLVVYDEVAYSGMDRAGARDRSWSYDETSESWRLGAPSPSTRANFYPPDDEADQVTPPSRQLVPCREDQYRSEETNRCRNIAQPRTLVPCREGQYRSEETNRCRSIATAAASVLKPCADDQFRNPLTNRCKKIASAEDVALADCGEGRERNPLTNRCRNVLAATMPAAPFAPEQVNQVSEGVLGWWALGGVSLVALGYAGWQWRFEVGRAVRRIGQALTSGGKGAA